MALTLVFTQSSGQNQYGPPAGYYTAPQTIEGLSGIALQAALNEKIRNHTVIPYTPLRDVFRTTDADPDSPNNVILIYSGQSMAASAIGASGQKVWNREHTWPQSFGTSSGPGNSDAHHIFPCNALVNELRSNLNFDWTDPADRRTITNNLAPGSSYDSNSFEPRDEDKGRIARALFYMDTRYDGRDNGTPNLSLADRPNSGTYTLGWLSALLEWNRMVAPDERERRRNHLIFAGVYWGNNFYRQGNRNPFVDYPELADAIYLPPTTVTYGTWRWQHFSLNELDTPSISGDNADPDGDDIPNLIELAANMDPRRRDAYGPLAVEDLGNGTLRLRYTRLLDRTLSDLRYQVEFSTDLQSGAPWQSLNQLPSATSAGPAIGTELVELEHDVSGYGVAELHYRLRVFRGYPIGREADAIYGPLAAPIAQPVVSIFLSDQRFADNWSLGWFGWVNDAAYPWTFHLDHHWQLIAAESPASVWIWDPSINWLWTSAAVYPLLYHSDSMRWLWHLPGSSSPQRWFWLPATSDYIHESNL